MALSQHTALLLTTMPRQSPAEDALAPMFRYQEDAAGVLPCARDRPAVRLVAITGYAIPLKSRKAYGVINVVACVEDVRNEAIEAVLNSV